METPERTDVGEAGSEGSENPYRFDAVDGDRVVSGKTPFLSRFCGGVCAIVGLLGMSIGTLTVIDFGLAWMLAMFVGSIGLLLVAWGLERDYFWAHCCFTCVVILAAIVLAMSVGISFSVLLAVGPAVAMAVFMLVRRRKQR